MSDLFGVGLDPPIDFGGLVAHSCPRAMALWTARIFDRSPVGQRPSGYSHSLCGFFSAEPDRKACRFIAGHMILLRVAWAFNEGIPLGRAGHARTDGVSPMGAALRPFRTWRLSRLQEGQESR